MTLTTFDGAGAAPPKQQQQSPTYTFFVIDPHVFILPNPPLAMPVSGASTTVPLQFAHAAVRDTFHATLLALRDSKPSCRGSFFWNIFFFLLSSSHL